MRPLRALLIALAATVACATPAAADRFALDYEGSTIGVLPLGDVTLDFDVTDSRYSVLARLSSSGLVSMFERTRLVASAEGRIENGQVRWERYDLDHHYSRKHRIIGMFPTAEGIAADINPTFRLWGEPPTSDAQRRASRDPLSSLVAMAVDVQRTRTCNADYPTFDGRWHYMLQLRGGSRDRVDSGGYEGPALRCRMRYVPVAGFEAGDGGRRRIPEGDIWFALVEGASLAPPVRIRLPMGVARAHIALARWRRPSVEIDTAESVATPPTP